MTIGEYLAVVFRRPLAEPPAFVGSLELAPHQARAVGAMVRCATMFGGVLLADAVGLGKTRVCLATAVMLQKQARLAGRRGPIWFVVPSRLVPAWSDRASRAGIQPDDMHIVTHTAMSRGHVSHPEPAVLVVDEAHRFRNPKAHRYRTLATLTTKAPVVLATATPVANSRDDLRQLLSLFLGDNDLRPWLGMDVSEAFEKGGASLLSLLERVVVRRTAWDSAEHGRPSARLELLTYDPQPAEAWVWANLGEALGSARLGLLEGDWPRGLFVEHALRLWESGPRALAETLKKLVEFHERWLEAEQHGERINRVGFRELFGSQPDQSVLPFMFAQASETAVDSPTRARVERDLFTLRGLAARVELAANDVARENAILELLTRHDGKLLIFTSFRSAARSMFQTISDGLGPEGRVGLVTGDEARATGLGRAAAHDVLRRFSPGAFDLQLPLHQTIDVLIATDCIAEGVDLHDCGRIVLADLPYSPLRVEQRIGRLLRPGSPHEQVVVHLPRPRNWNDSLGMRRRLSRKLGDAAESGTGYTALGHVSCDPPVNPLAVLTQRDAWLRTLPEPVGRDASSSVVVPSEHEDAVWLIARLEDGEQQEDFVVRVDSEGTEHRWLELLPRLDELIRGQPEVAVEELRTAWVKRAQSALQLHLDRINAARLAPFALSFDSAPRRAFQAIVEWAQNEQLELDVDALRSRMLRPWPRGTERLIEGWINEPWRGIRQYVELPEHPATRRVQVAHMYIIDARPEGVSCNLNDTGEGGPHIVSG